MDQYDNNGYQNGYQNGYPQDGYQQGYQQGQPGGYQQPYQQGGFQQGGYQQQGSQQGGYQQGGYQQGFDPMGRSAGSGMGGGMNGQFGYQQGFGAFGQPAPMGMDKKQLLDQPALAKIKSNIKSAYLICYIAAGITTIIALVNGTAMSFLDVLVLVGLGLGIQLKQSKGCAIGLLVYSIINMLILISMGTFGGWLILIAGIYAVMATGAFDKVWKEYVATGMVNVPRKYQK